MHTESYIFSRYDTPPDPGITFLEPTMAQQHFRDECDINNIMARYAQTGLLPQSEGAFYGDFESGIDYRQALEHLADAQASFDALPAILRRRFNNDPAEFLDFVSNPANLQEMVDLGLATFKPDRDSALLDVTVTTDTNGVDTPPPSPTDGAKK